MKTKWAGVLLAAALVAAPAVAQQFRVGGFYKMNTFPDSFDDYYRGTVHGLGAEFGWEFWGPLSAEVAASYGKQELERGAFFPEIHPPEERRQIPVTAALSAGYAVGPARFFGTVGGGFLAERYDFRAVYLEPRDEYYGVTTLGAGGRVRLPGNFYVTSAFRHLFVAGRQLDYWYQSGQYFYHGDHGDLNELTFGGGIFF